MDFWKTTLKWVSVAALVIAAYLLFTGSLLAGEISKKDMLDSVVKIDGKCGAVALEIPGADIKDRTLLVTAGHCVGKAKEGHIQLETFNPETKAYDLKNYKYMVAGVNEPMDLAALVVDNEEFAKRPKIKVAEKYVAEEGDEVWAVGYPLGLSRTITQGLLNQWIPGPFGLIQRRASPPIEQGNSGGGLFQLNGDHYELIGIASIKIDDGENYANDFINGFVSLDDLRRFVFG